MTNEETKQHLVELLDSIETDYEDFGDILNRCADRETVERYLSNQGMDVTDFDIDTDYWNIMDDSDYAREDVCGALEGHVMETMHDYPLSIDDSHVWFTLGGPNISANVTGWRVNVDKVGPVIDVQDITLKGRWGGASVDRDVWRGGFMFQQIAEMFEQNLLMKFGAF